jgi:hypothetical protein
MDAITKPFDPLALVAVIENALARHKAGAVRTEPPPPSSDPAQRPSNPELIAVDLELSEDPGLRRTQIAQKFAGAVGKMIGPMITNGELGSGASDERIQTSIKRALTPDRVGALAGLLRTLDFGADARVILSGDLSCISIAEVLQMLELQRQTGALSIASTNSEVTLYVRDGMLDLAQARGLPAWYRLGRYFVRQGVITQEELAHFLEHRAGSKRLIGDALLQLDMVTEAQVADALKMQTSELVYEVVSWKQGRFTFTRESMSPEATLAQLSLMPGGIVMEGFRRVDEWRLIEGSFDFDDTLQRDDGAVERLSGTAELTEQERKVLDAIDGQRTVRQILDHVHGSTFDVCKILYQFVNSRVVRRRAA